MREIAELTIPIPDTFRGIDPHTEVRIYSRNLPHWRQDGACYFVTFRSIDSIPEPAWREMTADARDWTETIRAALARHQGELPAALRVEYERFQRRYQGKLERLLDRCEGRCLLRDQSARRAVAGALLHFLGKRYDLYAAVIMPNHCHALLRPHAGYELEKIVGAWKSFTTHEINRRFGISGAFWQAESFDRIIRDEAHFRRTVRYILKNPAKASLPATDWWIWSRDVSHPLIAGRDTPWRNP